MRRQNRSDFEERGMHFSNKLCLKMRVGYNIIPFKRPGLLTLWLAVHHNNARPHTAVTPSGMLESLKWDSVEQPLFSPDLAAADFRIFGFLKKDLAGLRFFTDEEVREWATKWLHQLGQAKWKKAIFEMPVRWQKCINRDGDYREN